MRRNMPGNRGRGRGPSNNQGFGSSGSGLGNASGGPLMTNHLDLQELDLELALLKRKREMIEKQHSMLLDLDQRPSLINANPFGFNEQQSFSQSRNFPRPFESQQFSSSYNNQRAAKRPSVWESDFDSQFGGPPRAKAPNLDRYPSASGPRQSSPRRPPRGRNSNIATGKVTKPSAKKPNTHPFAAHRNMISQNFLTPDDDSKARVTLKAKKILYTDRHTVDNVLAGRIGLAMGIIMKEMRIPYIKVPPYDKVFNTPAGMRSLKEHIRQRLDTVLSNRMVGHYSDIVALYRKEYPKQNDLSLLKIAEGTGRDISQAIRVVEQDNPEEYIRKNFHKLLDVSLNKMFSVVEKVYSGVEDMQVPIQTVIDRTIGDIQTDLSNDTLFAEYLKELENEEMDTSTENASADAEMQEQTADNKVDETKAINPENDSEKIEEQVKDEATNNSKPEADDKVVNDKDDNKKPDETIADEKPAETEADKPDTKLEESAAIEKSTDVGDDTPKPKKKKKLYKKPQEIDILRAKFYSNIVFSMLKRALPITLPRYKQQLKRIIGGVQVFENSKEPKSEVSKTPQKPSPKLRDVKPAVNSGNTKTEENANRPKRDFFVKIIGRPNLPPKPLMKPFLDEFHPTLIKKHRHRHNNLFVSFGDKKDFDNILSKNNTSLGKSVLSITESIKLNKKENEFNLDDSLDSQITDLLSSIREEVEEGEMKEIKDDGVVEIKDDEVVAGDDKNATEGELLADTDIANNKEEEMEMKESGNDNTESGNDNTEVGNDNAEVVNENAEIGNGIEEVGNGNENGNATEDIQPESDNQAKPVNKELDAVKEDSETGKGTPTRASARLTRRSSKLGQ